MKSRTHLRFFAFEQRANPPAPTNSCLISPSAVQLGEILGTGHYGIVRRAQWNQLSVAVKTLRSDRLMKDLIAEINAMHELSHPYLVRLYGIILSDPLMMVGRCFVCLSSTLCRTKGH